jgi:hypothetical protein
MRTTEANKTVANAAISVCANVHIRIAFEAMISGISTAARRERPILEDILTPLAMPSTQLSTSSSLGCVAISLVVPTIVGAHRRGPAHWCRPHAELHLRLNQWRRRRDADGQAEIFIVRQNYRRIGEHFDQEPDTAVQLDQPVPRRKHESRFDGCFV